MVKKDSKKDKESKYAYKKKSAWEILTDDQIKKAFELNIIKDPLKDKSKNTTIKEFDKKTTFRKLKTASTHKKKKTFILDKEEFIRSDDPRFFD